MTVWNSTYFVFTSQVRGRYLESIDNLVQADADVIAESQARTQSSTRCIIPEVACRS